MYETPFVTFKSLGNHGRLGNQLFQIAATIGTARRNGCGFVFPQWEYAKYFEHPLPQVDEMETETTYHESGFPYREIWIAKSTNLTGYFQSEHYFKHCESEIRTYFKPNETLNRMLEPFLSGLESLEKTCSLSVRRGDYVGHPCFFDLSRSDYYRNAIKTFDSDTVFVMFSDDIEWCRKYFRGEKFRFPEISFDLAALFCIASCDHHIIANSSFAWWGAWLNQSPTKRVVAPSRWFAGPYDDKQGGSYLDTRDLLPDSWEILQVRNIH